MRMIDNNTAGRPLQAPGRHAVRISKGPEQGRESSSHSHLQGQPEEEEVKRLVECSKQEGRCQIQKMTRWETLWSRCITQLCLTLCDPMDCSPPGSSVHGILQARKLEWLPFPSPGDLPNPRIEPESPALQADSLPTEPPGKP